MHIHVETHIHNTHTTPHTNKCAHKCVNTNSYHIQKHIHTPHLHTDRYSQSHMLQIHTSTGTPKYIPRRGKLHNFPAEKYTPTLAPHFLYFQHCPLVHYCRGWDTTRGSKCGRHTVVGGLVGPLRFRWGVLCSERAWNLPSCLHLLDELLPLTSLLLPEPEQMAEPLCWFHFLELQTAKRPCERAEFQVLINSN